MIYYDIHTHRLPESYDPDIVSIYNVYPLDYDKYENLENSNLFFSVGTHPWYLDNLEAQINVLEKVVCSKRVVAIGEAGLDKARGAELMLQERVFRKQIEIAIEIDKPLIIHCVKAWDELIALYKEYKPVNPWIIHGFRGKIELAKQLTNLGFKLSFGEKFQKGVIESIPENAIFTESDDSDLSVVSICQNVSSVSDILIEDVVRTVGANVVKTFRM